MMRAALVFLLGMAMETGRAEEPAAPEAGVKWADQRKETFEIVWKTVDEAYFDPTFGGVDWASVGEKYRARLETAEDKPALRKLLQSMIGELRKTHFSILPREMSVFTPQERSRVGTVGVEQADAVLFRLS